MFLDILEEMKEWQQLAAYWKDAQQQAEAKLKERFKQDSAQAEWDAHRADLTGTAVRSGAQAPLEEQLKALREDYKARKEEDRQNSLASIGDGVNKYYQQEGPAETDKALQEDGALASMMADLDSFISAQEAQEGVTTA